jgi:hypothetical protein
VVRAALYALISIFLLTLIKLFAGIVMRAVNDALQGPGTGAARGKGGELKKCSICGTYAPKASAPVLKGTDAFVCSDACAVKYRA